MLNMSLSELEEEEEALAIKLRNVCTPFGDERESKIRESTEILYLMGCLYLKKAEITERMDQKLNLIKAATLLHGARIRSYELLKERERIQSGLAELQNVLMEKCSGKLSDDLSELSLHVQFGFENARIQEKFELDSLGIIDKELSEDKAKKKRDEKVATVQAILKNNSRVFIEHMQYVARRCLKIVGTPPCGFAIVGLGSLARDEVTLYSDFEHVIILEEGVQDREDYEKILEFFRWYSVVFHIIIIGVGETIIPSIGIESLNDLYSEDKSKSWFYDSFTPPGVSFDGMMPHACKIPIGRQKPTMKKDFIIELIKPVSIMALYLTKDEDMVNEYCLKDVLCETCFVFGSETIYSEFRDASAKILDREKDKNVFETVSMAAAENKNPHVREVGGLLTTETVDPKVVFYRPLSVLIGYAARVQRTGGKSGLERVVKLKGIQLSEHTKSLAWAYAVACEIRLKVYEANFSNRAHSSSDLLEHAGIPGLINCASAITDLSLYFKSSKSLYDADCRRFLEVKVSVLMFLRKYSDAKEELLRLLEQNVASDRLSNQMIPSLKKQLASIFVEEANAESEHQLDLFQRAENLLLQIENYREDPEVCELLSEIYYHIGRHDESKDLADSAYQTLKKEKALSDKIMDVQRIQLRAVKKISKLRDFIHYCEDFLGQNSDILSKLTFGFAMAKAQCENDEKDKAHHSLKNLVKVCTEDGLKTLSPRQWAQWMSECIHLQKDEGWFCDAVKTYETLTEILESGRKFFNYVPDKALLFDAVYSYIRASNDSFEEKIDFCEKAIKICRLPENIDLFYPLYCLVLNRVVAIDVLRNPKVFSISKMHEILMKAPAKARENPDVTIFIVKNFFTCYASLYKAKHLGAIEICHNVEYSKEIFPHPHPFLDPLLFMLIKKMLSQLEEGFKENNTQFDLNSMLLSPHHQEDIAEMLNNLWKSIFSQKRLQARREAIHEFLGNVYRFLGLRAFLSIVHRVSPVPEQLSSDPEIVDAVQNYFACCFDSSIHAFWKIINREKKRSYHQRLCIVFLCNAAIYVIMYKHGFELYTDIFKRQISAGPPDIIDRLRHNVMMNLDETPMMLKIRQLQEKLYSWKKNKDVCSTKPDKRGIGRRTVRRYIEEAPVKKLGHDNDARTIAIKNLMFVRDRQKKIRDIIARKADLKVADFIEHCKVYICENNDLVSRMEGGLALAKAQLEAGGKNEAQQTLTRLSKMCLIEGLRSGCPETELIGWLANIFEIQSDEDWLEDCVETHLKFEIISQSCDKNFDVSDFAPSFFSEQAAVAFLTVCTNAGNSKSMWDKTRLCEKAIEICKLSENLHECSDLYRLAIQLIIDYNLASSCRNFDIVKVYKVLSEAPSTILNSSLSLWIFENFSKIYRRFNPSLGRQRPNLYFWLFVEKVSPQLPYADEESLKVFLPAHESTEKDWHEHKNMILDLWKALHVLKKAYPAFLAFVDNFLCHNAKLEAILNVFAKAGSSPATISSFSACFRIALGEYHQRNFRCSKVFWKIINLEKKTCLIQKLAIDFLCKTIEKICC